MFFNKPIKGIVAKIDIDVAATGDWYIEHYKVKVDGFVSIPFNGQGELIDVYYEAVVRLKEEGVI